MTCSGIFRQERTFYPGNQKINMAGSTIGTLLEMIALIISNTISTLRGLFSKLLELGGNLGIVSSLGGPAGAIMAIVILAVVIFLLGKFILGTGKVLIFLMIIGILLVLAVMFLA